MPQFPLRQLMAGVQHILCYHVEVNKGIVDRKKKGVVFRAIHRPLLMSGVRHNHDWTPVAVCFDPAGQFPEPRKVSPTPRQESLFRAWGDVSPHFLPGASGDHQGPPPVFRGTELGQLDIHCAEINNLMPLFFFQEASPRPVILDCPILRKGFMLGLTSRVRIWKSGDSDVARRNPPSGIRGLNPHFILPGSRVSSWELLITK